MTGLEIKPDFREGRLLETKQACIDYYEVEIDKYKPRLGYKHLYENVSAIRDFIEYIYDAKDKFLIFKGYNWHRHKTVETISPYNHRWSQGYVNKLLHRLYNLEKMQVSAVSMVTMTTYQDSDYAFSKTGKRLSIQDAFELLIRSRAEMIKKMRKMFPKCDYIWMMEPHESGYPHCHMVFFGRMSDKEIKILKHFWSDVCRAGSYAHGLDVRNVTGIRRIRNYIMKYVHKSVMALSLEHGKVDVRDLCYHAVARENGYRFFGVSLGVGEIMRWEPSLKPEFEDTIWYSVGLRMTYEMYREGNIEYYDYDCTDSTVKLNQALEKLEQRRIEVDKMIEIDIFNIYRDNSGSDDI